MWWHPSHGSAGYGQAAQRLGPRPSGVGLDWLFWLLILCAKLLHTAAGKPGFEPQGLGGGAPTGSPGCDKFNFSDTDTGNSWQEGDSAASDGPEQCGGAWGDRGSLEEPEQCIDDADADPTGTAVQG